MWEIWLRGTRRRLLKAVVPCDKMMRNDLFQSMVEQPYLTRAMDFRQDLNAA